MKSDTRYEKIQVKFDKRGLSPAHEEAPVLRMIGAAFLIAGLAIVGALLATGSMDDVLVAIDKVLN